MNTEPTTPNRADAVSDLLSEQALNPTEAAALRLLLNEAAAPANGAELRGEAAALAAFRAARLPVRDSRSSSFMNRLTRILTVKAAAVAIAVTGTGGMAFAASTGVLPVPADTPVVGSEAKAEKKAKKDKAEQEAKVRDWSGLCESATTGNVLANPGKAADSTAFSALIAAAGGIAQVPAFCGGILGTPPTTLPPVEEAPAAAAEGENSGKSETAGNATAPGQLKEDGSPAQGKGKATAPGQVKKNAAPAPTSEQDGDAAEAGKSENSGRANAPGQLKADDSPAVGKGQAGKDKQDEDSDDDTDNESGDEFPASAS
ncbi:MAG: hypothetical protein ACT4QF_18390 [Sporichthyaceae bacterium]